MVLPQGHGLRMYSIILHMNDYFVMSEPDRFVNEKCDIHIQGERQRELVVRNESILFYPILKTLSRVILS